MTNKLLKWSRPAIGEGLRGEIWPQFNIFKVNGGFKLHIRYGRRDKYIKIETVREGKLKAAEILRAELNK